MRWIFDSVIVPAKYILIVPQKDRVFELRKKVDDFRERFVVDLLTEIHVNAIEGKVMDELIDSSLKKRLPLGKPCMKGTRSAILTTIENEVKSVDGHNMIWIRGSPGVGKSALAASILTRLQDQKRRVISFRFDRTQSTTITTDALWRVVACDLARLYPSFHQYLVKHDQWRSSPGINRLFENLVEKPLSSLGDVPGEELPVIVIDALDECGGLRHDSNEQDDYSGLLRTLKRWVQIDCLKKFKLVITSRPENRITQNFPHSVSIHDIPSGNDIRPGDSASNDIRAFLESKFNEMGMEPTWIAKALDYLTPRAAGIFIWATTVAGFLEPDPEPRFGILEARWRGDDEEGTDDLYSLYSTVVRTSLEKVSRQEIGGITSVMGAMIFAKEPLSDDALIVLPGVKSRNILRYIRSGLKSVIDTGSILHFHHRSFEDFLLSLFFEQELWMLSAVQDRERHEHQLAVMFLNTMGSSTLHFNICGLKTSDIRNRDILATDTSAISPLLSYSCRFWADHLVRTPCEKTLVEVVRFVMYEKLLFWMEVMSISGRIYEATPILKKALAWPKLKVCCSLACHGTYLMSAG